MNVFTLNASFSLKTFAQLKFFRNFAAKNLEHKFERNTILEYEKVIYNSFTDAIIS